MVGGKGVLRNSPSLLFSGALDLLPYFESELRQLLQSDLFAWVEQTKYLLDGDADLFDEVNAPLMQQPPAQAEISAVRLKVIAV
jgi:hypothetical protein